MADIIRPESDPGQKRGASYPPASGKEYQHPYARHLHRYAPLPAGVASAPAGAANGLAQHSLWRQLMHFWIKINRDWMFNLAGMLAYNLLLSVFPLLVLSISLLGLIFQYSAKACTATHPEGQLLSNLAAFLPGEITGAGRARVGATSLTILCDKLSHESLLLGLVGAITGLWFGSRLFVKLENCLGVIFRLRSRSFWRQNGTAGGMTVLFAILGPLSVLATLGSEYVLGENGGVVGWLAGLIIAFLLIELIYIVVPNQQVRPGDVWVGALIAACLITIYELLFPLYARIFHNSNSYVGIVGLIVIVLLFFYYLAIILLLGAEINSWRRGQAESSGDIATMLAQASQQGQLPPPAG